MAKSKKPAAKKVGSKKKAATEEKAIQLVPAAALNNLLRESLNAKNDISTLSGDLGAAIKLAAEKNGLHRGAYGIISRLYIMGKKDSTKLWLLLAHFDDMREKAGLDKLATKQGQLLPAIPEKPETKQAAAEKPAEPTTVVKFPEAMDKADKQQAAH